MNGVPYRLRCPLCSHAMDYRGTDADGDADTVPMWCPACDTVVPAAVEVVPGGPADVRTRYRGVAEYVADDGDTRTVHYTARDTRGTVRREVLELVPEGARCLSVAVEETAE